MNDIKQYKVLEFEADSAEISLSALYCCDHDGISIRPEQPENRFDLCFSVNVEDQDTFRIKDPFDISEVLCTVKSDLFYRKNAAFVPAEVFPERESKLRRFYTSPHALYKAVRRIRL